MPRPRLPFEPVIEYIWTKYRHDADEIFEVDGVVGPTDARIGELTGLSRDQVQRSKGPGVTIDRADAIACALKVHPTSIWGDDYLQAPINIVMCFRRGQQMGIARKLRRGESVEHLLDTPKQRRRPRAS